MPNVVVTNFEFLTTFKVYLVDQEVEKPLW